MKPRTMFWMALASALGAAGCGKGAPPAPTEITREGMKLTLPPGTQPDHVAVKVQPAGTISGAAQEFSQRITDHYHLLKLVDIGSNDPAWRGPAAIQVPLAATDLPKGRTLADVRAVGLGGSKPVWSLPLEVQKDAVRIQVAEPTSVAILVPAPNLTVLGDPVLVLRGTSELLARGDCPDFIRPESSAMKALVSGPARPTVQPDGTIAPPLKLAARPLGDGMELPQLDAVLASASADAVALSVAYASLFAAQGASVRIVAGETHYRDGSTHVRGYHQWAEVMHDGKPMFVDARNPAQPRLVELGQATADFGLELHRSCAKYPPGASTDPNQWSPPAAAPPAPGSASDSQLPFEITAGSASP